VLASPHHVLSSDGLLGITKGESNCAVQNVASDRIIMPMAWGKGNVSWYKSVFPLEKSEFHLIRISLAIDAELE
jgi:hypothetical protein